MPNPTNPKQSTAASTLQIPILPIMHQLFFFILLILQLVIFFILLLGKLFLRHPHKAAPAYSTNNWDKTLIAASILSIGIVVDLFIISQKQDDRQTGSNQQPITDSGYSKRSSRNRDSLLAKYGYQVDSIQNEITGIFRDSFKTNTLLLKETDPGIGLDNTTGLNIDSVKNNTFFLKLTFVNGMAAAANIRVKTVFAVVKDGNLALAAAGNYFILPSGSSMAANETAKAIVSIPYDDTPLLYCLLTGTCTNAAGTATYTIRKIYCYETGTKQLILAVSAHFTLLDNFYRRQGF